MASILLVDDNEGLRRPIEVALSKAGHDVKTADDGKAALRILQMGGIDLVITDIVMPEMDGLELMRAMRKTSPATRIIGMSGGGRGSATDYLDLAKAFGAAITLAKPFSLDEVRAAVESVLAQGPVPRKG